MNFKYFLSFVLAAAFMTGCTREETVNESLQKAPSGSSHVPPTTDVSHQDTCYFVPAIRLYNREMSKSQGTCVTLSCLTVTTASASGTQVYHPEINEACADIGSLPWESLPEGLDFFATCILRDRQAIPLPVDEECYIEVSCLVTLRVRDPNLAKGYDESSSPYTCTARYYPASQPMTEFLYPITIRFHEIQFDAVVCPLG